jgi:hypothetical protein
MDEAERRPHCFFDSVAWRVVPDKQTDIKHDVLY